MNETQLLPILLISLVSLTMALGGCRSDEEVAPQEEPAPQVDEDDDVEDSAPMAERREIFGLPLPPQYLAIRREDFRARVTTKMDLDELEAFFDTRLGDHEILRTDRELEIVPLRPHLAMASARHFGGRRSNVIVTYRQPRDLAETEAPEEKEEESGDRVIIAGRDAESSPRGERPRIGVRPDWLDDRQGQPVNLRTDDGSLLAPGAVWGEPYTPPAGSPLDTRGNRPNFGRPFGDWRAR